MHNFQVFYAYLFALLCVCITCRNISCAYFSVCLCVITWKKIYQAGEPETFLTLFGLSILNLCTDN